MLYDMRFGLNYALNDGLIYGLSYGLIAGLSFGLSSSLLSVLLVGRSTTVQPTERLGWFETSLKKSFFSKSHISNALRVSVWIGLILGVSSGLTTETLQPHFFSSSIKTSKGGKKASKTLLFWM